LITHVDVLSLAGHRNSSLKKGLRFSQGQVALGDHDADAKRGPMPPEFESPDVVGINAIMAVMRRLP
jgi:hypothetical protein